MPSGIKYRYLLLWTNNTHGSRFHDRDPQFDSRNLGANNQSCYIGTGDIRSRVIRGPYCIFFWSLACLLYVTYYSTYSLCFSWSLWHGETTCSNHWTSKSHFHSSSQTTISVKQFQFPMPVALMVTFQEKHPRLAVWFQKGHFANSWSYDGSILK